MRVREVAMGDEEGKITTGERKRMNEMGLEGNEVQGSLEKPTLL